MLTIAVSKGRILQEASSLLEKLGIKISEEINNTRKLVLKTNNPEINLAIIRATDVPTFVKYGAADMGIVGKDILMEQNPGNIYKPIDLKIAKCELAIAKPINKTSFPKTLRIATKFTNITLQYYASINQQVEIIKLYGSMEIAPILGLADKIVDLVATGKTLKENGLVVEQTITEISSYLIVNQSAMKIKFKTINHLLQQINKIVNYDDTIL